MITFRMTFIANSELCGLRVFAGHIPKFGCGASRAVVTAGHGARACSDQLIEPFELVNVKLGCVPPGFAAVIV